MGRTINELEWLYNKVSNLINENVDLDNEITNADDEANDDDPAEKVNEPPINFLVNKDLVNHIHSYIESKGFLFTIEEVTNLFFINKNKAIRYFIWYFRYRKDKDCPIVCRKCWGN